MKIKKDILELSMCRDTVESGALIYISKNIHKKGMQSELSKIVVSNSNISSFALRYIYDYIPNGSTLQKIIEEHKDFTRSRENNAEELINVLETLRNGTHTRLSKCVISELRSCCTNIDLRDVRVINFLGTLSASESIKLHELFLNNDLTYLAKDTMRLFLDANEDSLYCYLTSIFIGTKNTDLKELVLNSVTLKGFSNKDIFLDNDLRAFLCDNINYISYRQDFLAYLDYSEVMRSNLTMYSLYEYIRRKNLSSISNRDLIMTPETLARKLPLVHYVRYRLAKVFLSSD